MNCMAFFIGHVQLHVLAARMQYCKAQFLCQSGLEPCVKMAQPFQCLVRPPSGVVLGRLVVLFLHLRHFLPFSSHFQLLFKFLQQLSLVSHVSHVSLFSFRFHLCFWLLALDCDFRILCSKILHLQF